MWNSISPALEKFRNLLAHQCQNNQIKTSVFQEYYYKIITVVLIFPRVSEVVWILVSSETQVRPQMTLDRDYLPGYLSISYDYDLNELELKVEHQGNYALVSNFSSWYQIENGVSVSKLFDKRYIFQFFIVWMTHLSNNKPATIF